MFELVTDRLRRVGGIHPCGYPAYEENDWTLDNRVYSIYTSFGQMGYLTFSKLMVSQYRIQFLKC